MKRIFNHHFVFVFRAKVWLLLLVIFLESRNSMEWKGLSTVIILTLFSHRTFQSRKWTKMKRSFNCHFAFTFEPKVELCISETLCDSLNSRKMERTIIYHFGFAFTPEDQLCRSLPQKDAPQFPSIKRTGRRRCPKNWGASRPSV